MIRFLTLILLMLVCVPVQAQTSDADSQQQWPLLEERLAAVDASAGDSDAAALERLQARQALLALPEVRSRDRAFATAIVELRVSTAEYALKVAQLRQQSLALDRERDAILLEASRRDAELARKEAERLRLQALAREEEVLLNADAAAVADAATAGAALVAKDGELARLEEELAALANARSDDLVSLGGSRKGRYRLPGTAFLAGKATLQPEARQSLGQLGKRLKASGKAWSVEGFSDNLGSEESNVALSRQRAEAVMAVLRAAGVPAGKLSAKGWGSVKPLASNTGKSGRAQNRRVEIIQK
ncbi:MAG: OmpA family protein [Arenimonas sp.]|jgi:outer membrane protein OmpA-like peptidoglycan-associated protein|uniref:OmpA family protein n=1 Tax=Arenimonas sp. TaxID=1872635 RepID=UPI001B63B7F9|nr:OmpA family protein [Arenimonas sp.]